MTFVIQRNRTCLHQANRHITQILTMLAGNLPAIIMLVGNLPANSYKEVTGAFVRYREYKAVHLVLFILV